MNPFFPMNQNNDDDEERRPTVFEIDEETDVYFYEQAYAYHEQLVHGENIPRLTRNPIHRDREGAEERLMADYFDNHCRVRPDATGRMSLSVIMKCTAAIRQLAYGTTPDAFDEYLQMSEHTARDCLFHFNKCIISLYMSKYLRKPTLEDVENIYDKHVTRYGFLGMLGSIDSDANNDINVLDNSPLFDDLLDDKAPVAPYVVNGVGFEKGYYLADGIYPQWATFVKSFTVANDAKHAYFKKRQESARKDVERVFGVLQRRWGIIQQLARQYHVNTIRRIMYSCIIMHNMILEDQKMAVFYWNEVYANSSRNMQRTWVERNFPQAYSLECFWPSFYRLSSLFDQVYGSDVGLIGKAHGVGILSRFGQDLSRKERRHKPSGWISGRHNESGKSGVRKYTLSVTGNGRQPSGGIESYQFSELQHLIGTVELSEHNDSWQWSLDVSRGFSVASVRSLIDSCTLDDGSSATRWNNMIPIKVNIFLWRLSLNKLPSRMNLDRKGIEVDSLLCPICHEDVETANHTFFNCDMAKDLWALLARWWELDIPFCENISEWFTWLDSSSLSTKARLILDGVGGTLLWSIWSFRNRLVFPILLPRRWFFGITLYRNRFYGFLLEILGLNLVG
ncbi:nucleotide-binding alpha-beta plait domain-containing protein [Tanacetum coccineum]